MCFLSTSVRSPACVAVDERGQPGGCATWSVRRGRGRGGRGLWVSPPCARASGSTRTGHARREGRRDTRAGQSAGGDCWPGDGEAGRADDADMFGGPVRTQSAVINSSLRPSRSRPQLDPSPRRRWPRRPFDSLHDMLNLASKTRAAKRSLQRLAAGMATAAEPIGATKVPMSLLEPNAYINYQRIEDSLAVVRDRSVLPLVSVCDASLNPPKAQAASDAVRKDRLRSLGRPPPSGHRAWHQLPQAPP